MLNSATYDLLLQALNVLLVISLPLVGLTAIAGIIFGVIQAATSIHDSASAYAVKLLVVAAVLYAFSGDFTEGLRTLLETAIVAVGNV